MKRRLPVVLFILLTLVVGLYWGQAWHDTAVPTFAANSLQSGACAGQVHDLSQAGTPTGFVCLFDTVPTDTPAPATPTSTPTLDPTYTPTATFTAIPTNTATATPLPPTATSTPLPTNTPTAVPTSAGGISCAGDFMVDAGRGNVLVNVPSACNTANSPALILCLHGNYQSGTWCRQNFEFDELVESDYLAYAAPNGRSANSSLFWSSGDDIDTDYLTGLINAIEAQIPISDVFIVGYSSGGFAADKMACDHSDQVTAVVNLSGGQLKTMSCSPTLPVTYLKIHGDADGVILVNGTNDYYAAAVLAEAWRLRDGCDAGVAGAAIDLTTGAGAETAVTDFPNCAGGTVAYWLIAGGSHLPSFNPQFEGLVLDYLTGQ